MAIDTAAKRGSVLNFGSISTDALPVPSGTVSQDERLTLLDLYGGIAPESGATRSNQYLALSGCA